MGPNLQYQGWMAVRIQRTGRDTGRGEGCKQTNKSRITQLVCMSMMSIITQIHPHNQTRCASRSINTSKQTPAARSLLSPCSETKSKLTVPQLSPIMNAMRILEFRHINVNAARLRLIPGLQIPESLPYPQLRSAPRLLLLLLHPTAREAIPGLTRNRRSRAIAAPFRIEQDRKVHSWTTFPSPNQKQARRRPRLDNFWKIHM
jgi:hypothetical protein